MRRVACVAACAAGVLCVLILSYPALAPPPAFQGRLSPASLDVDTCGCPTVFGPPVCEKRTEWSVEKVVDIEGPLVNPVNEPFVFTVTVTEGPTTGVLSGEGTIVLTNSGEQTTFLSSVVVHLEDLHEGPGHGNAPGPSGNAWDILATAVQNESATCAAMGIAETCYETATASEGASLVLIDPDTNDIIALTGDLEIPPTLDNDGDGLRDEDPPLPDDPADITGGCAVIDNDGDGSYDEDPIAGIDNDGDGLVDEDPIAGIDNDGDGLVDEDPIDGVDNDGDGATDEDDPDDDGDGATDEDDPDDDGDGATDEDDPDDDGDGMTDEDGACEDGVEIGFRYEFAVGDLGEGDGMVPSPDDLRIDVSATFRAGGKRGGTCQADVDCDGAIEAVDGEKDVRTIQQRLRFDPPACSTSCECVTLRDDGARLSNVFLTCMSVESNSILDELICSMGEGTEHVRLIEGTVTCTSGGCGNIVQNKAALIFCPKELLNPNTASAGFKVNCPDPPPFGPGDFCTQTQGGWGAVPQGDNTGTLLHNNFEAVFPGGLVVGDAAGTTLVLESAQAVTNFLPQGGTPAILTQDQTNPLITSGGVFAGQIVAASLNLAFDDAGLTSTTFPPGTLSTMIYGLGCGVADGLVGLTVNEVLALANAALGTGALPAGVTISDLNDALSLFNENFVDCAGDEGCMELP